MFSRRLDDSPGSLERYAGNLKKRFLAARSALEAMAEDGKADIPAAFKAALELAAVALQVRPLANHPATLASPVASGVLENLASLKARRRRIASLAPRAAATRRPAALIGEILGLFETYERLIVRQLALIHRGEVPDYYAGLDDSAPFPSYRCSAANRGTVARRREEPASDARAWSTRIGGLIWPSPIVGADGTLFTGHADGEFVALNPDGSIRWRVRDARMMYIDSTGALGRDGFLYMASTDSDPSGHQNQGRIWKLDPGSGEVAWTFWGTHFEDPESNPQAHLSSFFEGNLALGWEAGRVCIYAGSDDNYLYKLDSDGNLVWEYCTDSYPSGVIWTKPLLGPDGKTVFVGDLACQVHAVEAATGRRLWVRRLGGSIVSSPALGQRGEIFLGSFDGRVYALAPEDGTVFWSYQTLGLIYSSPAVASNGDVVLGSSDGGVYRLDRFGRREWTYYTDAPVKSSPAIDADGLIYVGNQNGKLYCLSGEGRKLWSYHTNPDTAENDINCSPTIGADGTVYFESTTGEVFAVPRDHYYRNRHDEAIDLSPGDEGEKPDIPPGGAMLAFMDRLGTPVFEPPRDLAISANLNLAFFAVNDVLDIVPAEIIPESVEVRITPDIPHSTRVESMGRFIYVVPGGFLDYDTEYSVRASGSYTAEGEQRAFDSTVLVHTAGRAEETVPLEISRDRVTGVTLDGFRICQPKEIDALGQAMMDSLKFGVAPLYIDRERGAIVLAASMLVDRGGTVEYTPATVNKLLLAGRLKDGFFKLSGSMRLVAQGANIPIDSVLFTGRFTSGPGTDNGAAMICASTGGVPDFADIIRVMRLADAGGDVVGFCAYDGVPFESAALERPGGVSVDLSAGQSGVTASFDAPGLIAADHWVHVVFIDKATGAVVTGGRTEVATGPGGELTGLTCSPPGDAESGGTVAIVALDLFPLAAIDL